MPGLEARTLHMRTCREPELHVHARTLDIGPLASSLHMGSIASGTRQRTAAESTQGLVAVARSGRLASRVWCTGSRAPASQDVRTGRNVLRSRALLCSARRRAPEHSRQKQNKCRCARPPRSTRCWRSSRHLHQEALPAPKGGGRSVTGCTSPLLLQPSALSPQPSAPRARSDLAAARATAW